MKLFFSGDVRANEQLNLIVMHTVWMREHNQIAKQLQFHNPTWEDEQLFQEASAAQHHVMPEAAN